MADADLTYRGALEELREIHARLRGDDVDIDRLLDDVKRAADLLAFCRERLTAVGGRLEEVLATFEGPETPGQP
ncbi:MAG TPA: exodeoxyribonuclease VII small subunit [Acidimicrobiia bacterium]|jgi:exodeoxyribonuclease VII small subunit|nr:exodeoxyribonuclease VII small subunit [Acidimicrobiia bacterium]